MVMENYKEKEKNILHRRNTNNSQRLNDSKQIKYCFVVSQRNNNKTSKNTRKAKQTKLKLGVKNSDRYKKTSNLKVIM